VLLWNLKEDLSSDHEGSIREQLTNSKREVAERERVKVWGKY